MFPICTPFQLSQKLFTCRNSEFWLSGKTPFINVISEEPWYSHLLQSCLYLTCFYELGLSRLGFELPSACEANALTDCATAAVWTEIHCCNVIVNTNYVCVLSCCLGRHRQYSWCLRFDCTHDRKLNQSGPPNVKNFRAFTFSFLSYAWTLRPSISFIGSLESLDLRPETWIRQAPVLFLGSCIYLGKIEQWISMT